MATCIPPAKALATCIVLIGSQHNDSRSDGSQPSDGLLCIMHVMRLHIFECQNYGLSAKCVRTYTCLHFACGGSDKTYGRQHLHLSEAVLDQADLVV